jgi:hypothetical protein
MKFFGVFELCILQFVELLVSLCKHLEAVGVFVQALACQGSHDGHRQGLVDELVPLTWRTRPVPKG